MKTAVKIFIVLGIVAFFAEQAAATDLRSWDKKIYKAKERFKILKSFNYEAVLDKETQIVWEREPSAVNHIDIIGASNRCLNLQTGNRMGWRLPSVSDLTSLIDPGVATRPKLPTNHPFSNIKSSFIGGVSAEEQYWTATGSTFSLIQPSAYTVSFGLGTTLNQGISNPCPTCFAWCVRGGAPGPSIN